MVWNEEIVSNKKKKCILQQYIIISYKDEVIF